MNLAVAGSMAALIGEPTSSRARLDESSVNGAVHAVL
jgi:hypothetical protein